ncbi:unnamed protein product [Caenorhabditis auriculariae]|uniref:Uncharacterized protein n=1 Tax=Caenorhabditis auriculariae TaxID=2777116 RepID=A0A8S1HS99_9PELO|nr:unnamed protein product [Caenorhabditis auriculariae]
MAQTRFALLFAALLLASGTSAQNQDRECACDLANLWLDVGVVQVDSDIVTLFGQSTVGSGYQDPRSTRVGLVTYASTATQQFDLNRFNSTDDFIQGIFQYAKVSTDENSIIKSGLSSAFDLMTKARANNVRRNYKQVVIVYASDYKEDGENNPLQIADQIKESGTTIITVAFNQNTGGALTAGLAKIASPGAAFKSTDMNIVGEIQNMLCQVNCFCPDTWVQYTNAFNDPTAWKYGVCLRIGEIDSMWTAAKYACQNLFQGAYLATEFDNKKHDFSRLFFSNDTTNSPPYMYHIGLSYDTATQAYTWEQPANVARLGLSGQTYKAWNSGYPQLTSSTGCVLNQQSGSDSMVGWQNENCYSVAKRYVCELSSCDTSKYCDNRV